ncbi:zinc finger protein 271-like [Mercenaria mercenaria]|uniref:zinc finger protein 271-like n=1 Tax=Mercenaria mercenaria TaxID=6596 RepID=UPI00234E3DDE|nr:zinc finger protein 271-like [Mercenaria mercenaria]
MESITDNVCKDKVENAAYDMSVCNKSSGHERISDVKSSSQHSSPNTGKVKEESVAEEEKVNKMMTERKKIPDRSYNCNLCQRSFTRAHSLVRHSNRKHPQLKDVEAKQSTQVKNPKTDSQSLICDNPREICSRSEDIITIPQGQEKKPRKLKVIVFHKFPASKSVNKEREILETKEAHVDETRPVSEEEMAVIQTIKNSCQKLQQLGRQVLVVTANGEHSQWFGSSYGLEFAKDNTDFIASFFNYCKGKENSSRKGIKGENDTIEDLDIDPDGDKVDDFMDDQDEDYNDEESKGDADDDYFDIEEDETEEIDNDDKDENGDKNNPIPKRGRALQHLKKKEKMLEEDEAEEIDNDEEDGNIDKNNYIPKGGRALQHFEKKEKMFKDLAEGFKANEESREVSSLLRSKIGVRSVVFTVADLNRGEYNCTTCGYNFLWKCHLELHQVKNPHCGRVTNFKRSEKDILKESITFENPQTGVEVTSTFQELLDSQTVHPLSCAICGKSGFRDRFRLRDHVVQHNMADTFECNICCAGFSSMGFLSTHLKEHYRKSYECQRCNWRFANAFKLSQHTEGGCETVSLINNKEADESFEMITYKCDYCSAEVTGVKSLRLHLTLEHDKQFGQFDCVLCDKKFSDTKFYNRHLLIHNKKSSCPYCPKKFSEKSNTFYHHLKSHKTITEYPYVCDICGEKFKSKRHFDPHRRIHTGERPYVCEVKDCKKAFRSRDGLDQHKWCHKNEHYICDFCGRKFKKPSLLNNHRLSHTLDWRYPCIFCPQKFKKIRPFKRHLARLHPTKVDEVREKFKIVLHPCNQCPKVFFDKEDHTAHMYRHKGIKPFKCNYCGKGFSDKSNLTNHEHGHKGGKKLKCTLCSRKFNEEKYLLSHIERLHAPKQNVEKQFIAAAVNEANEEDMDELRESTLQIIDETIRGSVSF